MMLQLDLETWGEAVLKVYIAGTFCQNDKLSCIQGLLLFFFFLINAYPEVILR